MCGVEREEEGELKVCAVWLDFQDLQEGESSTGYRGREGGTVLGSQPTGGVVVLDTLWDVSYL